MIQGHLEKGYPEVLAAFLVAAFFAMNHWPLSIPVFVGAFCMSFLRYKTKVFMALRARAYGGELGVVVCGL